MRLTPTQIHGITQTISRLTDGMVEVFLFGSRLNEQMRGRDVDLLLKTATTLTLLERARLKLEVESLVNLPIDIVACTRDNSSLTPFQKLAMDKAVKLEAQ